MVDGHLNEQGHANLLVVVNETLDGSLPGSETLDGSSPGNEPSAGCETSPATVDDCLGNERKLIHLTSKEEYRYERKSNYFLTELIIISIFYTVPVGQLVYLRLQVEDDFTFSCV